ncbi:MAG: hypothetical protein IH591_10915 [Bacteroidales bacterium]|nr:hypothetical protein [Bacteroidales bacterium]
MRSSGDLPSQERVRDEFLGLLDLKAPGLLFYSPFSFLHKADGNELCRKTFTDPLKREITGESSVISAIDIEGRRTYFVWRILPWDSAYFNRKIIRIDFILPDHDSSDIIGRAVSRFTGEFAGERDYIFINIPCEDMNLIQGLSRTGFRLVETRLNYFFTAFDGAARPPVPVRRAGIKDIPVLRDIAMRMRNRYDRVHADPAFEPGVEDAYLGTFIEQSVKGFADMVIVPDLPGGEPFGFLAANNPEKVLSYNIAKLVLAAVDSRDHQGWLGHLLSGVIDELRKQETDILTTITQASNRPAIRTWEKAGFKLGFVTHVYSYTQG